MGHFQPTRLTLALAITALLAPFPPAAAQDQGDILVEGEGFTRIKIAIPDALTSAGYDATATELIQTVRDDLDFSGFFDVVDPKFYRLVPAGTAGELRHQDWLSIGADALLQIRLPVQDDRIDLEARLFDNGSATTLFARRYGGEAGALRRVAHLLSDDIVLRSRGSPSSPSSGATSRFT